MPTRADSLNDHLSRADEITLTVTGRKSGRAISHPVWFIEEGNTLYLVPVQGSDTQWYKNVIANPDVRVGVAGAQESLRAFPITEAKEVARIVDMFRNKYGEGNVKKYYSKCDVALRLPLN